VAPFDIYGSSMCDTMNLIDGECTQEFGEKVVLNKAKYFVTEPERGDIVVFTPKHSDEKYFIKRVIGLPGETVEILNGEVYVTNDLNPRGTKLDEVYLNHENKGRTYAKSTYSVFKVPEEEYFLLGDNREHSTDSRSCFDSSCKNGIDKAFIPKSLMEGKAWVSFWPISNWRVLDLPEYPELTPVPTSPLEM